LQSAPMLPSSDPNAPPGAGGAPPGAPPGGAPGGGAGGGAPGPGPVAPMDAGQGPIGKAAAHEESVGQEYTVLQLRENRQKAAARLRLYQSLARA
jgi:hypothetical protein